MSVDTLQEKIRKLKNPSVIDLSLSPTMLPPCVRKQAGSDSEAVRIYTQELLHALSGIVPAVRFGFASFVMLGADGPVILSELLKKAHDEGYYVLLDAPELYSVQSARTVADGIFGENTDYPCDGVVISSYLGSDLIAPFLPYCKNGKKDVFAVVRTANKSAAEIQDLLSGTRLVHAAAADLVNRFGAQTTGKSGYSRVGVVASASSAESLKKLRTNYPRLFLLLDGYDYPNSSAKNCSFAFDRFGRGAAAIASTGVSCAWEQTENGDSSAISCAVAAAERMKRNLTRYITIL